MTNNTPFMIIIAGPTGVGKSAFAEKLATYMPAEIVNADMGQLYKPLSIGTAKPDLQHTTIPHHLFDLIDKPISYTVAEYRAMLLETLHIIWHKKKIPLIVGGSSFYLQSIFFPPLVNADVTPTAYDTQTLWQLLHSIDPERASTIHPHDTYRIKRALDIWYTTGQKPSTYKPIYQPPAPYWFFFLSRERQDLYQHINNRVQHMMQAGWLQETQALLDTAWEPFLCQKKIIGYNDIIAYLRQSPAISYDELLATIAQKTRNYAKRQHTFWRMLEKKLLHAIKQQHDDISKIFNLNLTLLDLDLYIKQLTGQLGQLKVLS